MPQTDKKQIYANQQYNRRKRFRLHQCTRCGNDIEDDSFVMCEKCRKASAERERARRARHKQK